LTALLIYSLKKKIQVEKKEKSPNQKYDSDLIKFFVLPVIYSCGEFGEILFKHRQVHCKKKHILPPQAATSPVFALLRRGKQVQWSDSGMKRLHPPSLCELWRDKQARLPEFGEDVKKSLRLLSEERLSPHEVKTCVFVIFLPKIWAKKWGG